MCSVVPWSGIALHARTNAVALVLCWGLVPGDANVYRISVKESWIIVYFNEMHSRHTNLETLFHKIIQNTCIFYTYMLYT
jgi:hypothetical protein